MAHLLLENDGGCSCRLEQDIGLKLATEEATMKYFPASNSSREVLYCSGSLP
jgi:hypothetical protein